MLRTLKISTVGVPILCKCHRSLCKLVKSCSWPHSSQKWQNSWINCCLTPPLQMFPWKQQEKLKITRSQQPKELEQYFFNEPELTCSCMHLTHFTCLFYVFW